MQFKALFRGLAVAGAIALSTSAMADGFARGSLKDRFVAPTFSWTGFYAGLNAGYAWSDDSRTLGLDAAYPITAATRTGLLGLGNSSISADGFVGGGQIGYNWQSGATVLGLEADLNYTDISTSVTSVMNPAAPGNLLTQSYSIDWLATVRARLGYTIAPMTMLYVTGGFAFGDVAANDRLTFVGGIGTGGSSDIKTGWTIGGGMEYALNRNWTVKAEYLYVDLGKVSYTSAVPGVANTTGTHESDITMHTARLGINYKF
jgi:outer membrane immunogenic protein